MVERGTILKKRKIGMKIYLPKNGDEIDGRSVVLFLLECLCGGNSFFTEEQQILAQNTSDRKKRNACLEGK